jgi:hypothetical protein
MKSSYNQNYQNGISIKTSSKYRLERERKPNEVIIFIKNQAIREKLDSYIQFVENEKQMTKDSKVIYNMLSPTYQGSQVLYKALSQPKQQSDIDVIRQWLIKQTEMVYNPNDIDQYERVAEPYRLLCEIIDELGWYGHGQ